MNNEKMPVPRGRWTAMQVNRAVDMLQNLGGLTGATLPREIAESLKIVRDGYAAAIVSCPTILAMGVVGSKYPVLCAVCASTWARGTPNKMIFRIDRDDGVLWVAAYFGLAFMLENVGEENSLAGAEKFLDAIPDGDEDYVYRLVEFYEVNDKPPSKVEGEERGN